MYSRQQPHLGGVSLTFITNQFVPLVTGRNRTCTMATCYDSSQLTCDIMRMRQGCQKKKKKKERKKYILYIYMYIYKYI